MEKTSKSNVLDKLENWREIPLYLVSTQTNTDNTVWDGVGTTEAKGISAMSD